MDMVIFFCFSLINHRAGGTRLNEAWYEASVSWYNSLGRLHDAATLDGDSYGP